MKAVTPTTAAASPATTFVQSLHEGAKEAGVTPAPVEAEMLRQRARRRLKS